MKWQYNDGGRDEAGYTGDTNDCVVRAVAIIAGIDYQQVYDDIYALAKTERRSKNRKTRSGARNGVHKVTWRKYIKSLGFEWVPTMKIGGGCRVHLRDKELPRGRLIVRVSKHLTAVIDGVIHDTHDCSRNGSRCVY